MNEKVNSNEIFKSLQIMSTENDELIQLPRYKSHKEVWALKIRDITPLFTSENKVKIIPNGAVIVPTDSKYNSFNVNQQFVDKHQPKVGGYYVLYKDGYESWTPAEAFEEGYTLVESELDQPQTPFEVDVNDPGDPSRNTYLHKDECSVETHRKERTVTLYRDDSTSQVIFEHVKTWFWTADNTVLVISCYTYDTGKDHHYIHWPRERFCWFKDVPNN